MNTLPLFLVLLLFLASMPVDAEEGMLRTDSMAPFVHRISLYDESGQAIGAEDESPKPYSPAQTCGKCHPYETIARGWHFNAVDPKAPHGRSGEPWLLADARTGTQLPLSWRGWRGAWNPAGAGLRPWQFVQVFGRQIPGGGPGERLTDNPPDPQARWQLSGKLEIDCLSCHSADPVHDQALRATQIGEQNFRWIPTMTAGLGTISGAVKALPDNWDPETPPNPDHPEQSGPRLKYDLSRFDANDRVFLNITRRPSSERCYFCHTVKPAGEAAALTRWERDTDVHLKAGLFCVDCHRNGIDHSIVRGYEGEAKVTGQPAMADFSCRGCHEGAQGQGPAARRGGRFGAPRPIHQGLPPIHFEKMSCTACHAGSVLGQRTEMVQTSLAHGLGLAEKGGHATVPPFIAQPVLARQTDGVIAPHRIVWPAFWGRLKNNSVTPLAPDQLARVGKDNFPSQKSKAGAWKPLEEQEIIGALKALAGKGEGEPVYIADGRMFKLSSEQKLAGTEHKTANLTARGGYVLAEATGKRQVILMATGSEVEIALAARAALEAAGIGTRVVSMPCMELFTQQDEAYRKRVLPGGAVRVAVEAGVRQPWDRWLLGERGREAKAGFVGMSSFGASAPAEVLYEKFGISAEAVAETAKALLA